ncbi:MAG TPA: hypothetical protein VIP11_09820 [Gemmatimonadaceae bacterium]
MTRFIRAVSISALVALGALGAPVVSHAQDSTFKGITLNGVYDPTKDKIAVAVLPIPGTIGDSVRAMIQRDFEFSDRFTIVRVDTTDMAALRSGAAGKLNYPLFARLAAIAVVQITPVPTGLHVALHDVATSQVVHVGEMPLATAVFSRDWRMGVHRTSDEVEQWMTGKRGIAATRIAYMRGQAIRIVDSDGASEITVPTEPDASSPSWSPNGGTLAYSTFGANSRIMLMDLTTGRSRTLVGPTRNVNYSTPMFSPNGQSIVYSRSNDDQTDLYLAPVDRPEGGQRLTTQRGFLNSNPVFSPDGRQIVYVTNISGPPELYIMDADGTGARKLTDYDFDTRNYRSDPDWSPDGRLIAYQERVKDTFQLRHIRVSGSTPKWLTSEGENEQPAWAPDGRHLVFTSNRTGTRQLWIMDVESGTLRQLTKSGGSRLASWSTRLATP